MYSFLYAFALCSINVQGSLGAAGQLLRERSTIHSSTTQLEDVIAQAQAVRASFASLLAQSVARVQSEPCPLAEHTTYCAQTVSSLAAQRGMFVDIASKLGTVGNRFPAMNSLVQTIRRKKSKVRLSPVIAASHCRRRHDRPHACLCAGHHDSLWSCGSLHIVLALLQVRDVTRQGPDERGQPPEASKRLQFCAPRIDKR